MNRPKGLKSLPKSSNGTRRISVSFGSLKGQREEIRRRAWSRGWTVSRLVNDMLFHDWLRNEDRRIEQQRKRKRGK